MTWDGVPGLCEHSNDPSSSIKYREFLEQLSNCKYLKKSFVGMKHFVSKCS